MYLGIDLGGTNIAAGLVDEGGKIISKLSIPTNAQRHYSEIIKDMAEVAMEAAREGGCSLGDIKSVGIGSPGTCDNKNGVLIYANNLNFLNVPMRTEMQKYINKPVYIENDANCAALGEYKILNKEMQCFIAITLGTGVGGGVILDGKSYSGFNCSGGELGHMVIVKDGESCTCGRKGCWESYASANALVKQTKEKILKTPSTSMHKLIDGDINKVGGKTAFIAAREGDKAGMEVVKEYLDYVALGISNIINIFQPEMLVIGGGVSREGDFMLNPIKEYVKKETYTKNIVQAEIKVAVLGNDAGIIGAAML